MQVASKSSSLRSVGRQALFYYRSAVVYVCLFVCFLFLQPPSLCWYSVFRIKHLPNPSCLMYLLRPIENVLI